jgi:predicted extracellular nuclease
LFQTRILLSLLLLASWRADAQVVISQVYGGGGNTGATLKNDFIEIFNSGTSAVSLNGWSVQYLTAAGTGTWAVTPLTNFSLGPGQYYLIKEAQGAGGTVDLPTADATGTISMGATAGKVLLRSASGALSGACPTTDVVDVVGYGGSATCSETSPTAGTANATAAIRKNNGCTDTGNNSADFSIAAPTPRNSASATNSCSAPPPPPPPSLSIAAIQGNGNTSPVNGQAVTTTGIVTAVKSNGFFLQTPDASVDNDPLTSEGIFVFTSSAPPAAATVGNSVSVEGTVAEFAPSSDPASPTLTELVSPSVTLLTTGNPLPAPVVLTAANTNPAGAIDQLERFEGMRVSVGSLTVIAPTGGNVSESNATSTSSGIFFGAITGIARPFREPGVQQPDALPPGAPATVTRFDSNPERLRIQSGGQTGTTRFDVATGAVVMGITGVMDFNSRTYNILPDASPAPVITGGATATPAPAPLPGELTVASFNMERFFDTVDDPGVGDAVLTATAFSNRLNKASLAIRNMLRVPDILGIEEMENLTTLQAVANKVNTDAASPGVNYQAYLVEGNDPGGIDTGFLVNAARVTVIDVTQYGKTDTYINPNNGQAETLNDRPPLLLRATIAQPGSDLALPVTVIVNHLRSLLSINDPADGNRVRTKRRMQAEFAANLIQSRLSAGENVVSVGDYNAFQFNDGYVDVIGTIKGTPTPASQVVQSSSDLVNPDLTNLVDTALVPADQKYSYSFGGNAQAIDHVLVSPGMLSRATRFAFARNSADFPDILRSDSSRSERISDHDMPIAYFRLPALLVSAQVRVSSSGLLLNRATQTYNGTITVTNTSNQPIAGPVHVMFSGLTAGVTLANATGSYAGSPYITVSAGALAPGQSVTAAVRFGNPSNARIGYTAKTYSGTF